MVGRSISRNLALLFLFGVAFLASSCKGYFSSTIYPAYLQRADKVIHLEDIPEISRELEGKSFRARMRSFSIDSNSYLAIEVLFTEKSRDDLLILLTGDLRYKKTYSRDNFGLPYGYKFGNLFSEGYGARILLGFEYRGDNPTLTSKLVAFDPTDKELPIIQTDTDGVIVSFLGGIPTEVSGGGTWIVQVFNNNSLNFTLLPPTYAPPSPSPPSSGTNVTVFSYNPPLFTVSQYVKDPIRNVAAILFRAVSQNDERGWVVYRLPIGAPNTVGGALVSGNSFPYRSFQMDRILRDDLFFYTVDGVVRLSDEGSWSLFPFKMDTSNNEIVSNSAIEGPEIRIENSQVFHFTVDGKWFYVFDTDTLRVTRARTWW